MTARSRTAPRRPAARPRAARRPRSSPAGARSPGGGGGGGTHAVPLQPRQGHVPRGGLHQGAGDRLLHARGARAAAAPARPSGHAQALPRRRGRPLLLREAVPVAPARVGEHGGDPHGPQDDRLLPLRGPAHARVDGQPGRPRAAPLAVACRRHRAPDRDGLRPRPGPARRPRGVLRGRRAPARRARRAWASSASRRRRARRASRSTRRSTAARRPTTRPSRSRRRSRAIWRPSTRS